MRFGNVPAGIIIAVPDWGEETDELREMNQSDSPTETQYPMGSGIKL